MKAEFLKYFPHVELTVLGLALFILAFTLIVVRAYSKANEPVYSELSRLPLDLEEKG
jgi:cbb3-type cytochrome oxidase subunit 3